MKDFTNKNIQKENKFMIRRLIIFVIIIVLSFLFKVWGSQLIKEANEEITDLDSIIVSEGTKSDKKAYINLNAIPYQFAVSDDTVDSYYMVSDEKYLYIAYMGPEDFEKLNHSEIENNPVRIEGITKVTPEEIKKIAIEVYNEGLEEEEQIAEEEFNNYFGAVYLDMTVTDTSIAAIPEALFILFLLIGVIGTMVSAYEYINFKRSIHKMDTALLEELDDEMNKEEAFYYEKAHLYLTNKYIINFNGKFVVIDYQEIEWMYPYVQRVNGIKTSQAIKVLTKQGKTYTIASIEMMTKSKKEVYNEIWNTIVSKNNNIVLGYTEENIKIMKEKFRKKN